MGTPGAWQPTSASWREISTTVELYPMVHCCLSKKARTLISATHKRSGVGRPAFESLLGYSVQAEASPFPFSEPLPYHSDVSLLSVAGQNWLVDSSRGHNAHHTAPAAWTEKKGGCLRLQPSLKESNNVPTATHAAIALDCLDTPSPVLRVVHSY